MVTIITSQCFILSPAELWQMKRCIIKSFWPIRKRVKLLQSIVLPKAYHLWLECYCHGDRHEAECCPWLCAWERIANAHLMMKDGSERFHGNVNSGVEDGKLSNLTMQHLWRYLHTTLSFHQCDSCSNIHKAEHGKSCRAWIWLACHCNLTKDIWSQVPNRCPEDQNKSTELGLLPAISICFFRF